jgi:hypothetical protein
MQKGSRGGEWDVVHKSPQGDWEERVGEACSDKLPVLADMRNATVKLSVEFALGESLVEFGQNVRRAAIWFICSPQTVDKRCGEVCHAGVE